MSITHKQAAERMVRTQLRPRGIRDPAVLAAMLAVPRERFAPGLSPKLTYADHPLPTDHGQTISQPYVVAHMTELLRVKPGHRVLEIGTGSGYQTAILAYLGSVVVSVERHADLAHSARQRLGELIPDARMTVVVGDGSLGCAEHAPYDRILVTAAAPGLPTALDEQLNPRGRLLIPLGDRKSQVLTVFERDGDEMVRHNDLPCRFVPLIGADAWPG